MNMQPLLSSITRLCVVSNSACRTHSLDGTRGWAVLLVFFVHYHALLSDYLARQSLSFALSQMLEIIGHSGVDLFFILSGYLIYGIVLQKPLSYWSFQWRRVKRIYPTFLCVLTLYILLSFLFPEQSKLSSHFFDASLDILQNVVLLPGILGTIPIISVSWTLSYEFIFYLSIPLLIRMAGLRSWKRWQRMLLFLGLISLIVGWSLVARGDTHVRLIMFGVGILLWETLSYSRVKNKLSRIGEVAAIVIYVGSLALIYWIQFHPTWLPTITGVQNIPGVERFTLTAIGGFAFGLYCFGFEGILNQVFSWAPIQWLGTISYSYYLIHGLTLKAFALALKTSIPPSGHAPLLFWSCVPIALLLTLLSATLLFVCVEKPFSLRQRRTDDLASSNRIEPLSSASAKALVSLESQRSAGPAHSAALHS